MRFLSPSSFNDAGISTFLLTEPQHKIEPTRSKYPNKEDLAQAQANRVMPYMEGQSTHDTGTWTLGEALEVKPKASLEPKVSTTTADGHITNPRLQVPKEKLSTQN